MSNPRTFIFFGPSGSGKGTQSKLLLERLGKIDPKSKVARVSTGKMLREFMESGTHTALMVKGELGQGKLLPAFIPIFMWTNFLNRSVMDNTEHIIFDGVARRADEAPVLGGALSFYNRNPVDVVVIDVSKGWAMQRLSSRGRYDDTESDIKARLDWYDENTVHSVDYFREAKGYTTHDINGEQSIDDVHREILLKVGL